MNKVLKGRLDALILAFGFALILIGCGGSRSSNPPGSGGTTFTPASTQQWLRQFSAANFPAQPQSGSQVLDQLITGMSADQQGNIAISGYTLGAFSGYSNPNLSIDDFVAKFDSTGNQSWVVQFGGGGSDFLNGIAADKQGDFLAVGQTDGAFPGFTNPTGETQGVVVKLDGAGHQIWVQQLSLAESTEIDTIAIDAQGNAIVGGYTIPTQGSTNYGIFLIKLDGATGNTVWTQQYTSNTASADLNSVAVDGQGNAFVAGDTSGIFSGISTSSSGLPFLMKLDASTGNQLWVQQLADVATSSHVYLPGVAVDPQGNVIVGGVIASSGIVVGLGADPSAQALLAKFDNETGNQIWLQKFGTGTGDEISSVAVDPSGDILATGSTNGTFAASFTQPQDNIFAVKFSSGGQNIWVQQIGTGRVLNVVVPVGTQAAADTNGNLFIGGITQSAFPGFSNPNGAVQLFIAKFGP